MQLPYRARVRVVVAAATATAAYSWLIIALNVKFFVDQGKKWIESKLHDLDIKHQELFAWHFIN